MDSNTEPIDINGLTASSILVVEDDPAVRMLTIKLLEHLGFKVDSASDGLDALRRVEENKYCLILMDVQMPIMDGLQAAKAIRNHERQNQHDAIPIIATTAGGASKELCLLAGMTDYVEKPIDLDKMAIILSHWKCKGKSEPELVP